MPIEFGRENFESTLKSGLVIVDFWAPWCGPCKMIGPVVEELAKENPDVTIGKLNVDDHPELAGKHGVMSIPTLLFFKDGVLKDTSIGVVSKTVLQNKINLLKS